MFFNLMLYIFVMKKANNWMYCTILLKGVCFSPKTKSLWCIGNFTTTLAAGNNTEVSS